MPKRHCIRHISRPMMTAITRVLLDACRGATGQEPDPSSHLIVTSIYMYGALLFLDIPVGIFGQFQYLVLIPRPVARGFECQAYLVGLVVEYGTAMHSTTRNLLHRGEKRCFGSSPFQASRSPGAVVTDMQMGLGDSRFDMHPIRRIADGPLIVKAFFILYAKPIAKKAHSKSSNY